MAAPARWIVAGAAIAAAASWTLAESVPLPERPGRGIVPGTFPERPPHESPPIPEPILARRDHLTLVDVLEVALANDPTTQAAWREARSRADTIGVARSAYWPELDVNVTATRAKSAVQGGRFTAEQTAWGPGAFLTWQILDFGGRSGAVESARADALAAVWAHGATVQMKVLDTTEAYVAYVDAKAQLAAARTTEAETAKNLDAAQQRRDAGVATIADVLQAKTQRSQATLVVQTIEGSIGSLRGTLATAMGLPANVPFDSVDLPSEFPVVEFGDSVDALIEQALGRRPDLAAARESWLKAKADVKAVRGSWLPSLNLAGSLNRSYYDPATYASRADTWSVGVTLRIPVFNGLRNKYEIARAREDEGRAAAEARAVEQSVVNEVWTSWYDVKTAEQRMTTSKDLLASATESEAVALGRYTEGVGTLLDLLNAQSALATARAQEIAARTDWLGAAARLLYSTGGLTGPEVLPRPAGGEAVR